MPTHTIRNNQNELVERYFIPFGIRTQVFPPEALDVVRAHRREYATAIGEFTVAQKEMASKKDFAGAKNIKEIIRYFTSCEKSATIVINYLEKQTDLRTHDFPVDIAQLVDYEFHCVELSQ